MADKYFALDITESYIKIVDARLVANQIELVQVAIVETDKTFFTAETDKILTDESDKVAKLINQLKITKRNVSLVLTDSQTYNQIIQLPRLNEKELLSAIRYQADQFIPMPLDEINIDLEVLFEDKKSNKIETLISAAPKKIVEKIQIFAEKMGLLPESIETEISAMGRFLSVIYKKDTSKKQHGLLFVNLNAQSTSLYFFDLEYSIVTASHNFQTGYDIFVKEITVNLNVDPQKANALLRTFGALSGGSHELATILSPAIKQLVDEIQKFVILIKEKKGYQIDAINLFNHASQFPALDQVIGRYFGIQSSLFNPAVYFKRNPTLDANQNILSFILPAVGANLR